MVNYRLIGTALLLIVLASTLFMQSGFLEERFQEKEINPDCPWCEEKKGPDVLFIPINSSIISLAAPSDPDFISDLLWMRLTYYFGLHALTNREYPYLLHFFDLITDLSPKWDLPYKVGAILLPMEADALDEGLYLIEKGIVHHPQDWELLFYKGFYLFNYLKEDLLASEILFKASQLPDSPNYLARLSATLASRADHKEVALRFLSEALGNITDATQRKLILNKISEISENE